MGTLVVGLGLNRAWPLRLFPAGARSHVQTLGFVAMGWAAALVGSATFALLRRRTPAAAAAGPLIVDGPYRLSRHPMYLGLTLVFLGMTLVLGIVWPLLLLPLPLWIIDRRIIAFEEQGLEVTFGDAYRAYQRRVRRWL